MRCFNLSSYKGTFEEIWTLGNMIETKKRYIPMSYFGSTLGIRNYPKMFINNIFQNFRRPYSTYKANTEGYSFIHKKWFSQFIQHIAAKLIQFLVLHINDKEIKTNTLNDIIYSKTHIPEYCHVCNSFFSHMTFVENMTQYGSHVNPHFDSGDINTELFHVVDNTAKEGSINFYDGLDDKNIGGMYTSLPCEHAWKGYDRLF